MSANRLEQKLKQLGLAPTGAVDRTVVSISPIPQARHYSHAFKLHFPRPPYGPARYRAVSLPSGIRNFAGLVLGQGGSNLARIERVCNVRVEILPTFGPEDEICVTAEVKSDSMSNVTKATEMIREILEPVNCRFRPFRIENAGSALLEPDYGTVDDGPLDASLPLPSVLGVARVVSATQQGQQMGGQGGQQQPPAVVAVGLGIGVGLPPSDPAPPPVAPPVNSASAFPELPGSGSARQGHGPVSARARPCSPGQWGSGALLNKLKASQPAPEDKDGGASLAAPQDGLGLEAKHASHLLAGLSLQQSGSGGPDTPPMNHHEAPARPQRGASPMSLEASRTSPVLSSSQLSPLASPIQADGIAAAAAHHGFHAGHMAPHPNPNPKAQLLASLAAPAITMGGHVHPGHGHVAMPGHVAYPHGVVPAPFGAPMAAPPPHHAHGPPHPFLTPGAGLQAPHPFLTAAPFDLFSQQPAPSLFSGGVWGPMQVQPQAPGFSPLGAAAGLGGSPWGGPLGLGVGHDLAAGPGDAALPQSLEDDINRLISS